MTVTPLTIKLNPGPVVACKLRPTSKDQMKEVEVQVNEMLSKGVIRKSAGEFCSPYIMIRKTNGEWRFCVDFRLINKRIVVEHYLLPRIRDDGRSS